MIEKWTMLRDFSCWDLKKTYKDGKGITKKVREPDIASLGKIKI
jgi:hypothetical protein